MRTISNKLFSERLKSKEDLDRGPSIKLCLTISKLKSGLIFIINAIKTMCDEMLEARKKANKIEDAAERATAYCDEVRPYFDQVRYHVDKLEILIDDELWPLPKLREMLFTR